MDNMSDMDCSSQKVGMNFKVYFFFHTCSIFNM